MKFSLCDQYWNKYDSFVNIEDSLLFIYMKLREKMCLIVWDCAECGI